MTAVEWLIEQLLQLDNLTPNQLEILQQAKEMEKQQQYELAIGFSEWLDTLIERFGILEYRRNFMNKSKKQLLKIYKQEKGL